MRQMSILSRLRKENRATYDTSRRKTRIKGEWMREDWFEPNYVLGKCKKKDGPLSPIRPKASERKPGAPDCPAAWPSVLRYAPSHAQGGKMGRQASAQRQVASYEKAPTNVGAQSADKAHNRKNRSDI